MKCYDTSYHLNKSDLKVHYLSKLSPNLDRFAISASAICAIHCLSLPLFLAIFPALSTSIFGQESFHQLLLWFVIPLSLISLTLGCKRHKNRFVALLGMMGISILFLTATVGHDLLGEFYERVATLLGTAAIAAAHIRNYRLCRKSDCGH